MEQKLRTLIKELRSKGKGIIGGSDDPRATIEVWYVIAKLQEVLLEK